MAAGPRVQHVFSRDQRDKPFIRRLCCCCPCIVCCLFLLLSMVGLFLILFFLVPRHPTIWATGIRPIQSLRTNQHGTQGMYLADLVVKNPNFISWKLNEVHTDVYDAATEMYLGGGSIFHAKLHKRQRNYYEVPIRMNYTGAGVPAIYHNEVTRRLAGVCSTQRIPMLVRLKTRIRVHSLSTYHPHDWSNALLTC